METIQRLEVHDEKVLNWARELIEQSPSARIDRKSVV